MGEEIGVFPSRTLPQNGVIVYSNNTRFLQETDVTSINMPTSSTTSPITPLINQVCTICGDRSTGKHYGAASCDGCKGFFRRSVRKSHSYTCRFTRNCLINKDKRNQCRYCRLKKCFRAGMKKEAVQNERDCIRTRRPCNDEELHASGLTIAVLENAENLSVKMHQKFDSNIRNKKVANINIICQSMANQLNQLVSWAKQIPAFNQLQLDDQIALLKAHAGEQLLLGVCYRSFLLHDFLLLSNDHIITRHSDEIGMNQLCERIMDELIKTFREVQIQKSEFACLKAIVFFDPASKGLVNIDKVKAYRYQVQLMLEDSINDNQYGTRGRFGDLLLILPVLQSVSLQMVELMQFANMKGVDGCSDQLLQEMLLGGTTSLELAEDTPQTYPEQTSQLEVLTQDIINNPQPNDNPYSSPVMSPNGYKIQNIQGCSI